MNRKTRVVRGSTFLQRFKPFLYVCTVFVCVCFAPVILQAQVESPSPVRQDTTIYTDSLNASGLPFSAQPDSVGGKDTLYIPIPPIPNIGSVDPLLLPRNILNDTQITFTDYKHVGNMLSAFPGVYLRDLGYHGAFNGLVMDGVDSRAINIMSDGISLNDPMTGMYDLSLYQTEMIDRIEVVPTTRAFLYGLNSTGGAVNAITKSYQTGKPITRIRFVQAGHAYTMFDGLISQDVRRDLNVTLGVAHPAFGPWYRNNTYDAWNGRAKIRYNISDKLNIMFSDVYTQTRQGLNGGEDTATVVTNRYSISLDSLLSEYAYEKITRNDMQLTVGARIFSDSTELTSLTFYHSSNLREFRNEKPYSPFDTVTYSVQQDHRTQWYGGKLTQHFSLIGNQIDIGGEIQSRCVLASSVMNQQRATYTSVWGKDEIHPIPGLSVAGYARIDDHESVHHLSFGADGAFAVRSGIEVFGGFSHAYRNATPAENNWRDSVVTSLNSSFYEAETHNLAEAGIRFNNDMLHLSVKFFKRMIDNPIMTIQSSMFNPFPQVVLGASTDRLDIQGVDGNVDIRFGSFIAEGALQYIQMKQGGATLSQLPSVVGSGGFYFWDTLFHANLYMKTGLRGRFYTAHDGMMINQQAQMFTPSYFWNIKAAGTADFVLFAHFGDAQIHLIWENLMNLHYVVVPFFPMPDRQVRFGLNWVFLN